VGWNTNRKIGLQNQNTSESFVFVGDPRGEGGTEGGKGGGEGVFPENEVGVKRMDE